MKKLYSQITAIAILGFTLNCAPSFSQWNSNTALNTPICVVTGIQRDARIDPDGNGGAFMLWKDYRTGLPDIYVQHVDSNGVIQWALNGLGACTQSSDQSTPSMCTDMNGGIIVTWSDWRSGIERDIYAQRIDASGTKLWPTDGAIVTTQVPREHNERIVSDGASGAIIAWERQNTVTYRWEIWAQHIDSSGTTLWPPGGIKLALVESNQRNPKLQKDNSGGAYITWQDNRNGLDYDIYVQRVSANGTRLFGTTAIQVCGATDDQTNPKIDPGLNGGVVVAWADQRNGLNDIYCQLIDSLGNASWTANGVGICTAIGAQSAVDVLTSTTVNGTILTWKDERSGNTDIYAQKVNLAGVPQWTANGVPICTSTTAQVNPNIASDGSGGAVICWEDSTGITGFDIKAQRINNSGTVLWATNGVIVSNANGDQGSPKNVSDKNGGSIFVWEDKRTGILDIYCHRIFHDGYNVGIAEENNFSNLNVYPNPFANDITVSFNLEKAEAVSIKMFNLLGEEVAEINSSQVLLTPGVHTIPASLSNFNVGIYFLEIAYGNYSQTFKLIKN